MSIGKPAAFSVHVVRRYVEGRAGPASPPERRWQVFRELLASPKIPSELL